MKILLADDKQHIRHLLRKLVERHEGWSVCAEAETGIQAVALAKQFRPDLIILDLAMPELNGFDAARQISIMLPGVPIIMHTLYANSQVEIEAKKCGIEWVTSKPDTDGLLRAMRAALDAHRTYEAPTILGQSPIKAA